MMTAQSLPRAVNHTVGPSWRPRVGLVTPVKEEAPYLIEWIAYHRALGIVTFLIGDNGGSDDTSELLQALEVAGLIQRLDWRGETTIQVRFYVDAIPRMRGLVDICAVTDVDEFLRPLGEHRDIPTAVSEIFARPEVSAAALSWVNYGSSGRDEPGEGLVIERFTQRAADDHDFNRVVKSMLRPERFSGVINPHVFALTGGDYVDDRGEPVRWAAAVATTERASWRNLRVDHFVVKSRNEFVVKARRGRADLPDGVKDRDGEFFAARNTNETYDPMPLDFVARTKGEMAVVRDRLEAVVPSGSPLRTLLDM